LGKEKVVIKIQKGEMETPFVQLNLLIDSDNSKGINFSKKILEHATI